MEPGNDENTGLVREMRGIQGRFFGMAALVHRFLSDRLKLSRLLVRDCSPPAMSLVQEYSSGEEEGPVSPTNDAFGLASLPTTKKPRVGTKNPMSGIPHSAPDVLSEVGNV